MKHKLFFLLTVMSLMMPLAVNAQGEYIYSYFHEKDNNPFLTLDTKPENVFDALLAANPNAEVKMKEGSWFEVQRTVTDAFGNVHVTFNQMFTSGEFSEYQLVAHFRPDGSLYYLNGTIVVQGKEASQEAKGLKPSMISAEAASVIATGTTMSKVVKTFANCKGKPREAYKVTDVARMQDVYVDAYSGEVLYTISLFHSYAPWSEVNGNAVTLLANTSYYGLRDMTVMQTDNGYILRDPTRNIVTVDATYALADHDSTNLPATESEQAKLTMGDSDDIHFADKDDLRNQQYTNTLKGFTLFLDPKMEKAPESLNLSVYCLDKVDHHRVQDIINMDLSDVSWTDDHGLKKYTHTLETPLDINQFDYIQVILLTMDGEEYLQNDIIHAGRRHAMNMFKDQEMTEVKMLFDVDADITQPAIDVHWAIQNVYDMYEEYYGLKGCDGEGAQIVNLVNPGTNIPMFCINGFPTNACAYGSELTDCNNVPSFVMMYGMGGSGYDRPLTSLDLTAHEYTHNVTGGCGNNLIYLNESGALNEALADCMAMVAEDYVFDEPSWTIGEDITLDTDNLRSFSDPWYSSCVNGDIHEILAQPKYYMGKYWIDYNSVNPEERMFDHGGVHINSGVFNHLFYLLCNGAAGVVNEKGETLDMLPVGMDKMKDIIFHDMRYFNACLCTYDEIADNLLMVIEDFYSADDSAVHDLQNKFVTAYGYVGMTSAMIPSGITNVEGDAKLPYSGTYNLYGMPVDNRYKGVVIRNGRKYVN